MTRKRGAQPPEPSISEPKVRIATVDLRELTAADLNRLVAFAEYKLEQDRKRFQQLSPEQAQQEADWWHGKEVFWLHLLAIFRREKTEPLELEQFNDDFIRRMAKVLQQIEEGLFRQVAGAGDMSRIEAFFGQVARILRDEKQARWQKLKFMYRTLG